MPASRRLMLVGLLALPCLSGCGAGHVGPAGAVDGRLVKHCARGGCTSRDAWNLLTSKDVWCEWSGADVLVHVHLGELGELGDGVKAWIVPRYQLDNGSVQGTSLGPARAVEVGAIPLGHTYPPTNVIEKSGEATLNAGHPAGVRNGAPISKCEPCLVDAELVNPKGAVRKGPPADECV